MGEQEPGARGFFPLARYALYNGLEALGVRGGDEVLVPAYICSAAVEAISACGAVPVFFRIARDCSHDWQDAEHRISARTRAIVAVHYFGFPQDLEPARELANRRGLFLIEDCAHVLKGRSAGKALGSHGDFSIFSWRKFLPAFEGGELIINSRLAALQNHPRRVPLISELKAVKHLLDGRAAAGGNRLSAALSRAAGILRPASGASPDDRHQQHAGSDVASACSFDPSLAHNSISRTSAWFFRHADFAAIAAKRRQNYQQLWEELASMPGVSPLFPVPSEDNCPLYFPAFFPGTSAPNRSLRQLGIPSSAWDGVRPAGVLDDCFPDAGLLYNNLVFLPIHQSLGSGDIKIVSDAVRKVCRQSEKTSHSVSVPNVESIKATEVLSAAQQKRAGAVAQKRVLLVAFHFPPLMGSSGILRSLKYCRYLPEHGWLPTVLTVHSRAYERVDESQMKEIPRQVKVIRAFGLDARKHLSLKGSYLRYTGVPDRWVSWCLGAVPAGLLEIRKKKIEVILTTFPIATA
ncbi:MAG: DegT/DnrJ/EryC1/StrS family aminotransferase, partial [Actinomycetota bacterium]